jgi:hypothetical protein
VMYYGSGSMGLFPMFLGSLAGLLFLAGLVLLFIWLIRGMPGSGPSQVAPPPPPPSSPGPPAPPRESPLDILARRFASGEISAEEFEKARDLLKQSLGQ